MEDIVRNIKQKLSDLEKTQNIRIIYACESGSRAWGFASPDSDYDVRFVYVRPANDYLKLESQPDFIESELNEVYDINGWDITKFLKLLAKSNPAIFEWADSPIVYKTSDEWNNVKCIMEKYFKSAKMMYHYVSMAKKDVNVYLKGDEVRYKKYLYILRSVLACEWIMKKDCPPPTEFSKLVDEVLPELLKPSLMKLLDAKKKAGEKDCGPRFDDLDVYVEQKIAESEDFLKNTSEKAGTDWETLDKLFLKVAGGII